MGSNSLSEQKCGSNGWAIDELLVRGLKRLIQDLRAIEAKGFDEDVCVLVRNALLELSRSVAPGSAASFAPEIVIESGRFHQRYVEWNGNGTKSDDSAIRSRRGWIEELFFWRSRMMEKLSSGRNGFKVFATDDDFRIVSAVYKNLDTIVAQNPEIFKKLKASVDRFNRAAKARK